MGKIPKNSLGKSSELKLHCFCLYNAYNVPININSAPFIYVLCPELFQFCQKRGILNCPWISATDNLCSLWTLAHSWQLTWELRHNEWLQFDLNLIIYTCSVVCKHFLLSFYEFAQLYIIAILFSAWDKSRNAKLYFLLFKISIPSFMVFCGKFHAGINVNWSSHTN